MTPIPWQAAVMPPKNKIHSINPICMQLSPWKTLAATNKLNCPNVPFHQYYPSPRPYVFQLHIIMGPSVMMVSAIGISAIRNMKAALSYWTTCKLIMSIHRQDHFHVYGLVARFIIRNHAPDAGWKDMFYLMVAPSSLSALWRVVVCVLDHR